MNNIEFLKEYGIRTTLIPYSECDDDNYLINIISVIEDEIQKLNFNVNYKLWLDSMFAKLIGGGSND